MAVIQKDKILAVFIWLLSSAVFGTHLRCGEIQVQRVSANTFDISVRVFTNSLNTEVRFGGDQDFLDFGDGTKIMIPEQESVPVEDLGDNITVATFTVRHTYAAAGKYTVSYSEPNRNEGILNMDASVTTNFYLETNFSVDPFINEFSSPLSFYNPIFYSYKDQPFSASLASKDIAGSELHYSVVAPLQSANNPVSNYRLPENFKIDKLTGLITWDNKFQGSYVPGEYLFAIRIDQYLKKGSQLSRIGYVYRDFQIILLDENIGGGRVISDNVDELYLNVFNNGSRTFRVFTSHDPEETVDVSLASDLSDQNLAFETYDSIAASGPVKVTRIMVTIEELIVRNHPYIISVRTTFTGVDQRFTSDLNYAIFTMEYDPVMSVENIKKKGFFIPNPAGEYILIDETASPASVEVIAANGAAFFLYPAHGKKPIDVSSLQPGLYIIRLKDAFGRIIGVDRLMKK